MNSPELWATAWLDVAIADIPEGEQLIPVKAVGVQAVIATLAKTISYKDDKVTGASLSPSKSFNN